MQSSNIPGYHNLDIVIGLRNGDSYPLRAYSSVCGEEAGVLRFPYSSYEELRERVNLVYATLQDMRKGQRYDGEEQIIKLFGQELFESLISGRIHILYKRCIDRSKSMNKKTGLRLRLHISDPGLATVPWEYLYDPDIRNYVSFYHSSPVVRYMDGQQSTEAPRVKLPLRLLCMISSPTDLVPLNVEREKNLMQKALKPLIDDHIIEVKWLDNNQTYQDLQSVMSTETWHIFHFIGHGGFDARTEEGFLCFSDVLGLSHKINTKLLAPLLDHQRDTLKLVFLNTCEGAKASEKDIFSSIVGSLMINGVLSVVAMQQKISDRAAIVFSRAFYSSIANGMPIDASMSEARTLVYGDIKKTLEWGIPVLYMRAPDGVLFRPPTKSQKPNAVNSVKNSTGRNVRTNTRKSSRTNKQYSSRTLKDGAYRADPRSFRKSLPNTYRKSVLKEIGEFIVDVIFPRLGYFLNRNLNTRKFRRYRKGGILAFGFFFFLALDVVVVSLGIYGGFHSLPLTILAGIFSLILFIWLSMNEHTILGIVFSLIFGAAWCGIGVIYLRHVAFIIIVSASMLFAYFRFLLFKPTK